MILFLALAATCLADPAGDLAGYVTLDKAATTSIRRGAVVAGPAQPAHLGASVDSVAGQCRVSQVESGAAAEQAGFKVGDVIKSIDGEKVNNPSALKTALSAKRPRDAVMFAIEREGKSMDLRATLAAPSKPLRGFSNLRPMLGVNFGPETGKGVRIEAVTPGMPAELAGVKAGDLLQAIDGAVLRTAEAIRRRLLERTPGDVIKVGVLRDEKEMVFSIELATNSPTPRSMSDVPSLAQWNEYESLTFRKPVYRLAVIPIQFADIKSNPALSTAVWEKILFSSESYDDRGPTGQPVFGSVNDFYREQSAGKFRIEGQVFRPVAMPKNRAEYAMAPNRSTLLIEACDLLMVRDARAALEGFDGIFFIYAGARAQGPRGGIYWPHKSAFRYKGVNWNYFICPEGGGRVTNISVITHEFGHMLGLPDLYFNAENPGLDGLGVWCTMATGHGNEGRPLHFCAWSKEQMGWLKPVVIDPRVRQKIILGPVQSSDHECCKVLIRPDGSEYLLLENRQKKGFDRELPADGLLIWRIIDGKPQLEASHGHSGPDGPRRFMDAVPYPSLANNSYTPDTTPSSGSGKAGGWPVWITNIRRWPDGRISFEIGYEYL